jgi:hypothetical protein
LIVGHADALRRSVLIRARSQGRNETPFARTAPPRSFSLASSCLDPVGQN